MKAHCNENRFSMTDIEENIRKNASSEADIGTCVLIVHTRE